MHRARHAVPQSSRPRTDRRRHESQRPAKFNDWLAHFSRLGARFSLHAYFPTGAYLAAFDDRCRLGDFVLLRSALEHCPENSRASYASLDLCHHSQAASKQGFLLTAIFQRHAV